jgi:hypothetical protein
MKSKLKLKPKVENSMENQGFPTICIEKIGMKFLKKKMEGEDPFKKEQDELKESYEQSKLNKKEREELLKEIGDRNGF